MADPCIPDDESTNNKDVLPILPSSITTKIKAKKQRRRLSVAPEHVGDITELLQTRRFSDVTKKHIPAIKPKTFVAISKKGYVPYNKNKVNQDSYFCDYNFDGRETCHLFGVCDGHGLHGHDVSALVARNLPDYLKTLDYLNEPEQAIRSAVKRIAENLRNSQMIDTSVSGTTLVFSLIVNDMCYTANIGDSRCIIISQNPNAHKIYATALSVDDKLEIAEEKERILRHGGRVAPLPAPDGEYAGPYRVWLPDINIPGLAMSRSLGDDVAHSVGVSSEPTITKHKILKGKDLFLVYGSDGLWEFISNNEVAEIVIDVPDLKQASMRLVKEAAARWRKEEYAIDDITAIIYNLSPQSQPDNMCSTQAKKRNSKSNNRSSCLIM